MMFAETLIIGILAGFLVVFLNYCFGKPGSDNFSPLEIFSFYTVWLAKMRLKKVGLFYQYKNQFDENKRITQSPNGLAILKNDYKKIYYEAAEPFFTWERSAGMCPVCFGVWVALITGLIFYNGIFNLIAVILISHITIRLLTKII